jgi:hypothetical protein
MHVWPRTDEFGKFIGRCVWRVTGSTRYQSYHTIVKRGQDLNVESLRRFLDISVHRNGSQAASNVRVSCR